MGLDVEFACAHDLYVMRGYCEGSEAPERVPHVQFSFFKIGCKLGTHQDARGQIQFGAALCVECDSPVVRPTVAQNPLSDAVDPHSTSLALMAAALVRPTSRNAHQPGTLPRSLIPQAIAEIGFFVRR